MRSDCRNSQALRRRARACALAGRVVILIGDGRGHRRRRTPQPAHERRRARPHAVEAEAPHERDPAADRRPPRELRDPGRRARLFPQGPDCRAIWPRAGRRSGSDLVTAAEMRETATAQLAEIARKLQTLPAELDALKAQGAQDVVAEQARIAQAAAVERERLDRADAPRDRRAASPGAPRAHRACRRARDQDRRGAHQAIHHARGSAASRGSVHVAVGHGTRNARNEGGAMTSRAAGTRYARALFDVALKEADIEQAGRDLAAFAAARRGERAPRARAVEPRHPGRPQARRRRAAAREGRLASPPSSSSCSGSWRIAIGSRCCPTSPPPTGTG